MQLGEARVRDAQLDRRDAGLDRVDVLPVDVALRGRQPDVAGQDAERPLDPEAPQQAGRADVHRDQVEHAVDIVETEVVDAHDLAAVDVDDLLVEEVGAQLDLVRALLELGDVDGRGRQPAAGRVEAGDRRPRQEDVAPVRAQDQPGHGRIAVAEGDDEIVHPAERLACGVEHGSADGLAQVEHGYHLTVGPIRRGWRDPCGAAISRQGAERTECLVTTPRAASRRLGPSSTMGR